MCSKNIKEKTFNKHQSLGDFHRLIAARLTELGANIGEIEINHRKRNYGISKYGFSRILNVIVDIMFIKIFIIKKKASVCFWKLWFNFIFNFFNFNDLYVLSKNI